MTNQTIPAWLNNAIISGLQALKALSLEGSPSNETIGLTAQVWLNTITRNRQWNQVRDIPRIEEAFAQLCTGVTRWPAPVQFLNALPSPRLDDSSLVEFNMPEEQRKRVLQQIQATKAELAKATAMPVNSGVKLA